MKFLMVGDWCSKLHEEAASHGLEKLGHEVRRFAWCGYFNAGKENCLTTFGGRLQNKFIVGPAVEVLNRDLLRSVGEFGPDVVFIYRGTHIKVSTIREIRRRHPRIALVGYNNDDPFAKGHPFWLWRHFLASVPSLDLVLAYRQHNIEAFRRIGAPDVRLLRSWFVPEQNRPLAMQQHRYACDVLFAGHYEPDGRVEALEGIVRGGYILKLHGPGKYWNRVLCKSKELRRFAPVEQVWGEEYNETIYRAKIALCFLSKLNRDTYTRRCFEIPASGTFLLCEYSKDMAKLFVEGVEAEFFRSREELLRKVDFYLKNDRLREAVADAGRVRVNRDGHDVVSRMRELVGWIEELKETKRAS